MSNGTSKGVTVKGEGYVVAPTPAEIKTLAAPPKVITMPDGVTISTDGGFVVAPTEAEKRAIVAEIKGDYPDMKPGDTIKATYTVPDTKEIITVTMGDAKPLVGSVKLFGAELPEGAFKDVMLSLRQALAVEEGALTGQIFGIKNPELERAAAQVNKFFDLLAPQVEANMFKEPGEFAKEASLQVASYMPFIWAVNFKNMSKTEMIINGAIDVAILASLGLGMGLRTLNARKITTVATTAGKAADKMDDALRVLRNTSVDSKGYARVASNAQIAIQASKVADARFITALERVKALTGGQLSALERKSGVRGLKAAILEVSKSQVELDKAWAAIANYPTGSKKYIRGLPRVTQAQSRLALALENFDTALKPRYKFAPSPEFEGFAMDWRAKILPTFEGGQPKVVPLTDKGKGVQLAVMVKTKPTVSLQKVFDLKLKPVYTTKIAPKVRGVAPKVKATGKVSVAPVAVALARGGAEYDPHYRERVYAKPDVTEQIVTEVIGKPMEGTKLVLTPDQVILVNDQLSDITKAAIKAANEAVTRHLTKAQTESLIQTRVEALVKAITQVKVKTQVKTKVKLITRLATKLATSLKLRYRILPHIILPDGSGRFMTPAELAGAVGWKQGFIYKMIFPPYGQNNMVNSRKPIKGIKYHTGPQSAYRSITKIGGKIPDTIKRDMGIMDITITTPKTGKPRMAFKLDRKQKTKLTPGAKRLAKLRAKQKARRDKRRKLTPSAMVGLSRPRR